MTARKPAGPCCTDGRCEHHCPLCAKDHHGCVFTAGSLYCVTAGCCNPHHRKPPRKASR